MFLQSESVDGHGSATAVGGTTQDTIAGGVVGVELFVGGSGIPTHEVIKQVIGQGCGGAAVGAAGDVAPAIVATGVDLPCFGGAGGTGAISQATHTLG